ncbi:chaperone [Lithospermum erythrorhizon]|uniref:Chaperone n=1 Tax=Lithospermum erythrorhizon TaxID=34254 RepID=A0AAV3PXR8_LITER
MEGGGGAATAAESGGAASGSYRYWVREKTQEAAPLPQPKKLSANDISNQSTQPNTHLGSAWNRAGTWEEKNLNKWANDRMKELLGTVDPQEFSGGIAEIAEVTRCSGDAFLVTVRNKKRVGYTFELTVEVKGEWTVGTEKKKVKGHLDVLEFSFGELDDLQVEVKLSEEKDFTYEEKQRIIKDMKSFLKPLKEKLAQFEQELKDR